MRRDSAPSREARKVAPTIPSRSSAGGGLGTDFDCDGGLIPSLAKCLTTGTALRYDADTDTILPVAHTLRGEGFDASEDGTGRGTPLVPVACIHADAVGRSGEAITPSPDAEGRIRLRNPGMGLIEDGTSYNLMASGQPHAVVAFDTTQITSAANYSNPKPGDACHPLAAGAHPPAIAFHPTQDPISSTDGTTHGLGCGSSGGQASIAVAVALRGREGGATAELGDEVQNCLRASSGGGDKPHVLTAMQVRRLTPRECERLQGFPDDYTLIPYGRAIKAEKLECDWIKYLMRGGVMTFEQCARAAADGPRYKALGNSWAVPNVAWIGRRIDAALKSPATQSVD
jgi:DNA (cytosine-5)-methyltransferase 1